MDHTSQLFLLILVLAQVTWPMRNVKAARRCSDACYRNREMYCKVIYGGHVAMCAKCAVPCSRSRQEDQRVCAEFCKDSEYYASTETPLEGHIPAESIHEISTLPVSPISDAPSTSAFTSEQLTTKILTSLETQNMTMPTFEKNTSKNTSITTNTSSDVRGRHVRKSHLLVGDVFNFFLPIVFVLSVSSLVLCLGSNCAQFMEVKYKKSKVRPVYNNRNVYESVPLYQVNAGNVLLDQSMAKQIAVTKNTPQGRPTYQTACPPGQTVTSQPSDCTDADRAGRTHRVVSGLVKKKGSAKSMEGKNRSFTPRDEKSCKTVMPDDPASKLAAASSHEELFT